jgi:tRNA-(ms[2]io[6]A)-hydroxylase
LLSDHAHLEKKAASNALDLLNRWPAGRYPAGWISALSGVARDETFHLQTVIKLLKRLGGRLERTHNNPYASGLYQLVRRGQGNQELLDRLLVSALIEARSCERFALLAQRCRDIEMAQLYSSLKTSEQGHYTLFLDLAKRIAKPSEIKSRWTQLLDAESEIIAAQPPGPRVHSGIRPSRS